MKGAGLTQLVRLVLCGVVNNQQDAPSDAGGEPARLAVALTCCGRAFALEGKAAPAKGRPCSRLQAPCNRETPLQAGRRHRRAESSLLRPASFRLLSGCKSLSGGNLVPCRRPASARWCARPLLVRPSATHIACRDTQRSRAFKPAGHPVSAEFQGDQLREN